MYNTYSLEFDWESAETLSSVKFQLICVVHEVKKKKNMTSAVEHPLLDEGKRTFAAEGLFRSIIGEQAPEVIAVLITSYSQWFKQWRPQWPKNEHHRFLTGRISASGDTSIGSYHWRNTGGTIISLNTLPTMRENVDNRYGEKIKWTVSFHRQSQEYGLTQSFGVTQTPPLQLNRWTIERVKSIMIDGDGESTNLLIYNHFWREMHKDEETGSSIHNSNEHWYQPEELKNTSGMRQIMNEFRSGKRPPAVVETYHFEWSIEEQMMTIYDPEMRKMGKKDKPYTWWLWEDNNWHLKAKCDGYKSKLEYKFVDTNAE